MISLPCSRGPAEPQNQADRQFRNFRKKFWKDITVTISLHSQKRKRPVGQGVKTHPFHG